MSTKGALSKTNIPNKICQKIKNRFVGEYQWYFKSEIHNTKQLIENLGYVCDFIDLCNLLQFVQSYMYHVSEFIRNNKKLFEFSDMLYVTLPDILKCRFFGFKTNFFDADKVEPKHTEEGAIFQQSEPSNEREDSFDGMFGICILPLPF